MKNIKINTTISENPVRINTVEDCGGKKGKGSCGNWAGATIGQTNIKIKS